MRAIQDYHTHTFTSYDGQQTPAQLVASRAAAGITHLAITDHADFVSDLPAAEQLAFQTGTFGPRQRWYEEEKEKGFPLQLAMGVEIGEGSFCPKAAEAFIKAFPFDFVIGSMHRSDGCKDPSGLDFSSFDYIPMLDRYFEDMTGFVKWGQFDILGHITYPFRYISKIGLEPPRSRYTDAIAAILRQVIASGKGIEINVSTLHSGHPSMPSPEIAALYKDLGGELITVGTDDHRGNYANLPAKGLEILRNSGFSHFTAYRQRRPEMIRFD